MNTKEAMETQDLTTILLNIMGFLVWAEADNQTYGGVDAEEALESFRHLMGYDETTFQQLKDIALGEYEPVSVGP